MSFEAYLNEVKEEIAGLSDEEKRRVAAERFDPLVDEEFFQLPADEQRRIRKRFVDLAAGEAEDATELFFDLYGREPERFSSAGAMAEALTDLVRRRIRHGIFTKTPAEPGEDYTAAAE
jgi:hypothetical protein